MRRTRPSFIASSDTWQEICSHGQYSTDQYCLLLGDAEKQLSKLPDGVVNTCLTSPPYWRARDYEHELQIGLEGDVQAYVENLVAVFQQVKRVLTNDGTVWLNLGDRYLGGCTSNHNRWQRNKQLALVPFRVAIALQDEGWWVRNVGIWHKPNAQPSSVRDRLTNTWESVFLLAKAERYYFELDAIRVPHKTQDQIERERAEQGDVNGKAKGQSELRRWLNSPRHRATIDGIKEIRRRPNAPEPVELAAYLRAAASEKGVSIRWVAEQLDQPFERVRHYFRTDQIGSRLPPEDTWEALKDLLDLDTEYDEAMEVEVGDNIYRHHPLGRNPGDLFSIAVRGTNFDHFAVMPEELAEWCLKATLPPDGICLDPFSGSGTTGRATLRLGGRYIGVDIRQDYLQKSVPLITESLAVPYQAPLDLYRNI